MSVAGTVLIGSLILSVGIQVYHRLAGAFCVLLWCIGTTCWGFYVIEADLPFRYFFIPKDPFLFGFTMSGFIGYCLWKFVQALRLHSTSRSLN